jgi:hypothetical protein
VAEEVTMTSIWLGRVEGGVELLPVLALHVPGQPPPMDEVVAGVTVSAKPLKLA